MQAYVYTYICVYMYVYIYIYIYIYRERASNANMNNIKHQISTYSKREGEGLYTYRHTRRNACSSFFSGRPCIAYCLDFGFIACGAIAVHTAIGGVIVFLRFIAFLCGRCSHRHHRVDLRLFEAVGSRSTL